MKFTKSSQRFSLTLLVMGFVCTLSAFSVSAIAADTDSDGIEDNIEQTITFTDYLDADTDDDGLLDGAEDKNKNGSVDFTETNAKDADTDDDGLRDGQEDVDGDGVVDAGETNPLVADSDYDLLNDGLEMGRTTRIASGTSSPGGIAYLGTAVSWIADSDSTTTTDPLDTDTDNDGLSDGAEDEDRDGFKDVSEPNPRDADTDDDGLSDGQEDINQNGVVNTGETDPLESDSDDDGLNDGLEKGRTTGISGGTSSPRSISYVGTSVSWIPDADGATTTNPLSADTDNDGLADGVEDSNHNGRVDAGETNPAVLDIDADQDGYYSTVDCDDTDNTVYPGAVELCDGIDNDCDGFLAASEIDNDGDHYVECTIDAGGWDGDSAIIGGHDCDDTSASIHPGATETCYDGIDQNCDGANDFDQDGDGYVGSEWSAHAGGTAPNTGDCSDTNAAVNPAAAEVCGDNIDNDCDGQIDEGCNNDFDGDGLTNIEESTIGTDPNNDDSDGDGVDDYREVFVGGGAVSNPADADGDAIINALDTDDDGDNLPTISEDLNGNSDPTDDDLDDDTSPNYLDYDDDGDGVETKKELFDSDGDGVLNAFENSYIDSDGDGLNNQNDSDDDGDNVPTALENRNQNSNLFDDDTDGDTVPDFLDPDDDGDGILTKNEDANGNGNPMDDDSDMDGIPDYLDAVFTCFYRVAGDLTGDCKVDFDDFAIMAAGWLADCIHTPADPACVPIDDDRGRIGVGNK